MKSISLPVLSQNSNQPKRVSETTFGWNFDDPADGAFYLFEVKGSSHLYVADGSRIYEVNSHFAEKLRTSQFDSAERGFSALRRLGIPRGNFISDAAPDSVKVRSFSLAIAQKCNLGCAYCYAQEGDFGAAPQNMPLETAIAAVERLFEEIVPGKESVRIAFLGGEPLINRKVVRAAALHAARLGDEFGVPVSFSITSNGTLITPDDADFFDEFGFNVTISLDGDRAAHDSLRPYKSGRGSYEQIISNIQPLLARQQKMRVSARVTVTPRNLRLSETLRELISLGFSSVGFSPMLSSPTKREEMGGRELRTMLAQLIECGQEFERRLTAGEHFPFSNIISALQEIHRGTHRPYPCGAGGGYLGVSAQGELFACHRFVGDQDARMGDLTRGVDSALQKQWLGERHVHKQEPCRTCWARYLCGGGCHHEVINRGRVMCEYVRGWLDYCLKAYVRLSARCPEYFVSN